MTEFEFVNLMLLNCVVSTRSNAAMPQSCMNYPIVLNSDWQLVTMLTISLAQLQDYNKMEMPSGATLTVHLFLNTDDLYNFEQPIDLFTQC